MNISILIPTRGKPELLIKNIQCIFQNAECPEEVEVIIRADFDDYTLPVLLGCEKIFKNNISIIIGRHFNGYRDIQIFFEECAKLASGKLMMLYNDDFKMLTDKFDSLLIASAKGIAPITPRICKLDDGSGSHYSWSCVTIPRDLYSKIGEICPGQNPVCDRAWESVSKHCGLVARAEVTIQHNYVKPEKENLDRTFFLSEKQKNRPKWIEMWDHIGRETAKKICKNDKRD